MGHPIASNVRSMLHEGRTMIRCLPHCQLHTSWLRREPPPRVLGPTMVREVVIMSGTWQVRVSTTTFSRTLMPADKHLVRSGEAEAERPAGGLGQAGRPDSEHRESPSR